MAYLSTVSDGESLIDIIAPILGLDPHLVTRMVLDIPGDGPVTVDVTMFADGALERVIKTLNVQPYVDQHGKKREDQR